MSIRYRTAGAWGPGEATDLEPYWVDENFYELEQGLEQLQTNPPQAVSIEDITVDGNMMTIHLSNGQTEGPFALPMAKIRFTGEYVPGATMLQNDLFTSNQSIYIVNQEHVAPPVFDPELMSVNGPVYNCLIPKPVEPYDISFYYAGVIPGDSQVMLVHAGTRDVTILQAFDGSQAFLNLALSTAASITFEISHNATLVGTIEFTLGADLEPGGTGQFGVFVPIASPADYVFLVPGDRLTIKAPDTFDGVARGLAVTIAAQTQAA